MVHNIVQAPGNFCFLNCFLAVLHSTLLVPTPSHPIPSHLIPSHAIPPPPHPTCPQLVMLEMKQPFVHTWGLNQAWCAFTNRSATLGQSVNTVNTHAGKIFTRIGDLFQATGFGIGGISISVIVELEELQICSHGSHFAKWLQKIWLC